VAVETDCPVLDLESAPLELVPQPEQREVLGLGLEHYVEVASAGGVTEKVLEAERVDEIGVGAELRENQAPLDTPPIAALALLDVEAR
jgi:hypothetical protein